MFADLVGQRSPAMSPNFLEQQGMFSPIMSLGGDDKQNQNILDLLVSARMQEMGRFNHMPQQQQPHQGYPPNMGKPPCMYNCFLLCD